MPRGFVFTHIALQVALDFEEDMKKAATSNDCEVSYEMPDGQVSPILACSCGPHACVKGHHDRKREVPMPRSLVQPGCTQGYGTCGIFL